MKPVAPSLPPLRRGTESERKPDDKHETSDPKGTRTLATEADVRNPIAMETAVKQTIERFGKLDLAVNNAGVTGPAGVPVQDVEADIWREVIDTDLTGIFYSMKYDELVKKPNQHFFERQSKKLQRQGARIPRNEAY